MPLAPRIAALAAVLCLTACGGGGGGDTSSGSDDTAAGSRVTGIVAVGAPLAGATVESWCADGQAGPTATASPGGIYELQMPASCSGPWVLRATGSGRVLLSYGGDASGSAVALNITSLTDLVVRMVAEVPDDRDIRERVAELMAVLDQKWSTGMPQMIDVVSMWLGGAFPTAKLLEGFSGEFTPTPGVPLDDILEALDKVRGEVPLDALLEQVQTRGGDLAGAQPWKTLFGSAAALSFAGTDCTATGMPVAPVTVTLRMQGDDLVVEGFSTDAATPASFIVGPATRSDFGMVVRGNDPVVQVSLSTSLAGSMQLFNNAGTPMLSFSGPGLSTRTCSLDNPLRRADLVAFQPAARIRSAMPAAGISGNCAASGAGPAYSYAITPMGDIRFNGTSLPADWLDLPHAYYSESLQFNLFGEPVSYQVQLSALESAQGIQPYYYRTVPYGVNCTAYNP